MSYCYNPTGIQRLKNETQERFHNLMNALIGTEAINRGSKVLTFDASKIRLAVDDFTTVLKEIRKLK